MATSATTQIQSLAGRVLDADIQRAKFEHPELDDRPYRWHLDRAMQARPDIAKLYVSGADTTADAEDLRRFREAFDGSDEEARPEALNAFVKRHAVLVDQPLSPLGGDSAPGSLAAAQRLAGQRLHELTKQRMEQTGQSYSDAFHDVVKQNPKLAAVYGSH